MERKTAIILGVAAVAVIGFVIYKKMNKKDETETASDKSLNPSIVKNPALKEGMLGNATKKLNKLQASKPTT